MRGSIHFFIVQFTPLFFTSRFTRNLALVSIVISCLLIFIACAGQQGEPGPPGPAGPAGEAAAAGEVMASDLPCADCHNDTTLIFSKPAQFYRHSVHGIGEAYVRGSSASCAGCHGSEGAEARIAANLPPHDPSVEGVINVSPYNCRTCHNIHTTYTTADTESMAVMEDSALRAGFIPLFPELAC